MTRIIIAISAIFLFNQVALADAHLNQDYPATIDAATNDWPDETRNSISDLIARYGMPDSISSTQLVWLNTDPFKRTILHREPVLHNFPEPHRDFLEQVIDYRVPLDLYDEIAMYDGSVLLNRTSGEMSAKCHIVEANFLALNLANDIVMGTKTPEEARQAYGEAVSMHKAGNTPDSMQGLLFVLPQEGTADPDFPILDQAQEK